MENKDALQANRSSIPVAAVYIDDLGAAPAFGDMSVTARFRHAQTLIPLCSRCRAKLP